MWLATTGLACGGGDDGCDGFVTINARPEECEIRAERFGCSTFEVDGPLVRALRMHPLRERARVLETLASD